MLSKLTNNKGFTIIEVVIVLAIAGLIFAVVFLAVPRLQEGQRDSQRRSEIAAFQAAVTQFQSNNDGNVPTNDAQLQTIRTQYADLQDPTTGPYTLTYGTGVPAGLGEIVYRNARVCNAAGTAMATGTAGARQYAALYRLEQGGPQCVDNS